MNIKNIFFSYFIKIDLIINNWLKLEKVLNLKKKKKIL